MFFIFVHDKIIEEKLFISRDFDFASFYFSFPIEVEVFWGSNFACPFFTTKIRCNAPISSRERSSHRNFRVLM